MSFDLEDPLMLKIDGELGKNQSLSVDSLIEICKSLQDLIITVAETNLSSDFVNLNNFKLNLTGFEKSSAVPIFDYVPCSNDSFDNQVETQRRLVSDKVKELFSIANEGNFGRIRELYPDTRRRNMIADRFHSFSSSFKNSPVYVVKPSQKSGEKFDYVFSLKKFSKEAKEEVSGKIEKLKSNRQEDYFLGEIKLTDGKKPKVLKKVAKNELHSLAFAPKIIEFENFKVTLNHPLRCYFDQVDEGFIIECELLDIVVYSDTIEMVEKDFNEEFIQLYLTLNSLKDKQLTKHNKKRKAFFDLIVKEVEG